MPHSTATPADLINRAFLDASASLLGANDRDVARQRIAVEGVVLAANSAFAMISAHDTAWHAAVFDGELIYDEADDLAIVGRYRAWLQGCQKMLPSVKALEDLGSLLAGAEVLRTNIREVHGLLAADGEFFEGEGLDRLTAEAVAADDRGEAEEFREMGD